MPMWDVPIISQASPRLCWEACAQMMWRWRWRDNPALFNNYNAIAGRYRTGDRGLNRQQMTNFYTFLGMSTLDNAKGANVRYALAWTPVIVTDQDARMGHALIISGSDGGSYSVINPAGIQEIDFEGGGSQTGTQSLQPFGERDHKMGPTIWYWGPTALIWYD